VVPNLKCPSDGADARIGNTGTTNYMASRGDWLSSSEDWGGDGIRRGFFIPRECYPRTYKTSYTAGSSFSDIRDGSSNTIAMSERVIGYNRARMILGGIAIYSTAINDNPYAANPQSCYATVGANGQYLPSADVRDWSGMRWADGGAFTRIQTIIPPNGPSCTRDGNDAERGILPPTSYHPGGVNAMLGDGSVRFITETINCGDLSLPNRASGPSNYGVWGALGSAKGGEPASQ
jgi:prepilin-type processing-associated H-X9-DG protein